VDGIVPALGTPKNAKEDDMNKSISWMVMGALLIAGPVFGQAQSKKQQKCINALNKGMAKVATAQTRANAKCVTSFAKGKNADAANCLLMAPKVDKAATRTCTSETKSCSVTPDFGYTNCTSVNISSEGHGIGLAWDLYVANVPLLVGARKFMRQASSAQR